MGLTTEAWERRFILSVRTLSEDSRALAVPSNVARVALVGCSVVPELAEPLCDDETSFDFEEDGIYIDGVSAIGSEVVIINKPLTVSPSMVAQSMTVNPV